MHVRHPKTALLLIILTLLSGCSVYDVRQLIAPSDTALLIRQDGRRNTLDVSVADEKFTHLNGVRVDPGQLPTTPSHSLAVETQDVETQNVETQNVETQNVETQDVETQNVETQNVETQNVETQNVETQNFASLPSPATLEQAQKTLIQYLAQVEKQPETVEKLIPEAEQLAQSYPNDALLQSLLQRLLRYSDWQPVSSIINSAGIDFVSVKGWQPESPFMRTRRALLPPVADDEQVIFGDQRLVLLLTNVAPVTLHVDARLEDVPFLPEAPAQLLFQVDDRPTRQLALADKADWRRFTVTIPAGEHSVRFYQQQPVGNQYVKLRFDDAGVTLAVAQERPYFISTAGTPLEFYSQGPSVLRIDELNGDAVSYRYQNVPEGWHKISLPPPAGKPRSLLRVSQRVVNLQPKPLNNRIIQRTLNPVAEPEPVPTPPATTDKVELTDAFKLGKQEDGTLSVGVDFVRRNNVQESESGSNLPEEQFVQHRLSYRYFDEPHDAYWNTLGFFRIREHGYPSFGLDESVYYNPDWLPFTVRSSAKVIAQVVQVPLGQVAHDELAALGQGNLTFTQAYNLHPKTRLIPSLTFFARAMSLNIHTLTGLDPDDPNFKPNTDTLLSDPDFKLNAEKIDQDVYTPYKADHTAGLIPALTLEHRPWLDTIWSTRVAMGTNEDFDLTRPDHYSTEAHWQQLMGSVALDTFYRITFYQADDYSNQQAYPFSPNRNNPSKRSFTGLELNWQHWTAHQNRIEVAAQYTYDIERRANLATLSFTYYFGEGRGYRDFAPNEFNFRDIRQRLGSNEHNNVMRDADPSAQ